METQTLNINYGNINEEGCYMFGFSVSKDMKNYNWISMMKGEF